MKVISELRKLVQKHLEVIHQRTVKIPTGQSVPAVIAFRLITLRTSFQKNGICPPAI